MELVAINDDGTATVAERGTAFVVALADCVPARRPDGTADPLAVLTPNLVAADGTVVQVCCSLLGGADAQRLVVHALHAAGAYATLRAAALAAVAAIVAGHGVVRIDPTTP